MREGVRCSAASIRRQTDPRTMLPAKIKKQKNYSSKNCTKFNRLDDAGFPARKLKFCVNLIFGFFFFFLYHTHERLATQLETGTAILMILSSLIPVQFLKEKNRFCSDYGS